VTGVSVGVLNESSERENRVALDPDAVARLTKAGRTVLLEPGAGAAASFRDSAYVAAGATLTERSEILSHCDVLAVIARPSDETLSALHEGQTIIGLLEPLRDPSIFATLAANGVTAAAFELVPRTLTRTQSMDALSSQASTAGYRAAIVAAESFGRYLPMMITAAGTARPASAIVIGAGVAGLQAIGTLARLGAVVTGYDVRPASRTEVESLGANFLTSSIAEGAAGGGYARAMTAEELASQQDELSQALTTFDIVITTAKVPGRTPPMLVTGETLEKMKPGSVCVDLGASELGGNVFGSVDGETRRTEAGVLIVGAGNLASDLSTSSSQMYARNVASLLESLLTDDVVTVDPDDEVHANVIVCHGGAVTNPAVRKLLEGVAAR
jgi:H+-translocating NAD(P) transhydrogenase subunit alpha